MFSLFKYDSPLVQTCNKIVDCICLSVLWIITSLPVITVGASTTALYYAINTGIRCDKGGVWRSYWHSFRMNFKQATILWLLLFVIYSLLGSSCYSAYILCLDGQLPKEMFFVPLIALLLVMAWANMIFPYLAKFRNSTKMILKNCFGIGLLNFHIALLQPVFFVLAIAVIAFFPIAVLCAPGMYMVLSCYTLEPVFRKYMSEEDRAKEDALLQD